MVSIASLLPAWVVWPSWRSTLSVVVFIVGTLLSYIYIAAARAIQLLLPKGSAAKKGKKKL
jgi:hypothetical protein